LTALKTAGFVPGSVFCSGNGGDQATRALVANLYGAAIINDGLTAYTINDANGVKALGFVKTAIDQGLLVNGALLNGSDDINKFVSGKASFTILWGNVQQIGNGSQLAARHIDVVAVPFPAPQGQTKLEYLVNGFAVVKNKDAAKVEASKKFVRFLCDDSRVGRWNVSHTGGLPVRKSFSDTPINEQVRLTAGWTKYYSVYYNTVNGFAEMRNYWHEMLQSILKGTKPAQRAADDFVKLANESLQGGNK
jgi:multiple sugar transport system substrate-binding protein